MNLFTNFPWFAVVWTLIYHDLCHHCGQNVVDSWHAYKSPHHCNPLEFFYNNKVKNDLKFRKKFERQTVSSAHWFCAQAIHHSMCLSSQSHCEIALECCKTCFYLPYLGSNHSWIISHYYYIIIFFRHCQN